MTLADMGPARWAGGYWIEARCGAPAKYFFLEVTAIDSILEVNSGSAANEAEISLGDSIELRAIPQSTFYDFSPGQPVWSLDKPQGSALPTPAAGMALITLQPDLTGEYLLTATCGETEAYFTVTVVAAPPSATPTPGPTATPRPTATAFPTATPVPTATPLPGPTPTPTPEPPKIWDVGTSLTATIDTPESASITVGPGALVTAHITASDEDHYTQVGTSGGTETDHLSVRWSAAEGSFAGSIAEAGVSWKAPDKSGTYTLNCNILDDGVVPPGDQGTRLDATGGPVVRPVTVIVRRDWSPTWTVNNATLGGIGWDYGANDTPIKTGYIVAPQDQADVDSNNWVPVQPVLPGTRVSCIVSGGTDWDAWYQGAASGRGQDELHYHWQWDNTQNGANNGTNPGGFTGSVDQQSVSWTAPSQTGDYVLGDYAGGKVYPVLKLQVGAGEKVVIPSPSTTARGKVRRTGPPTGQAAPRLTTRSTADRIRSFIGARSNGIQRRSGSRRPMIRSNRQRRSLTPTTGCWAITAPTK